MHKLYALKPKRKAGFSGSLGLSGLSSQDIPVLVNNRKPPLPAGCRSQRSRAVPPDQRLVESAGNLGTGIFDAGAASPLSIGSALDARLQPAAPGAPLALN
jgi:hypothetical protein